MAEQIRDIRTIAAKSNQIKSSWSLLSRSIRRHESAKLRMQMQSMTLAPFYFIFDFFFFNLTFMGLLARAPLPLSATAGWSLHQPYFAGKESYKTSAAPSLTRYCLTRIASVFHASKISRLYISILHWRLTLFVLSPIDYTYNLLQYDLQVQLRTICEFSSLYTYPTKSFTDLFQVSQSFDIKRERTSEEVLYPLLDLYPHVAALQLQADSATFNSDCFSGYRNVSYWADAYPQSPLDEEKPRSHKSTGEFVAYRFKYRWTWI